jgi:hypothetical protein
MTTTERHPVPHEATTTPATTSMPAGPEQQAEQNAEREPIGAIDIWADSAKDTFRRLWEWFGRDTGFGQEHPPCLSDLFMYWSAAPMAGDNPVLRWVQRVHGFTLGLIFTLIGYAFAWLGQRPLRQFTFLLIFFIFWRLS